MPETVNDVPQIVIDSTAEQVETHLGLILERATMLRQAITDFCRVREIQPDTDIRAMSVSQLITYANMIRRMRR